MRQFLHHHEIGQALYKNEYGVTVCVNNQIHLKISEPFSVSFRRPVMLCWSGWLYWWLWSVCAAPGSDAGNWDSRRIAPQFTAVVGFDYIVDALH